MLCLYRVHIASLNGKRAKTSNIYTHTHILRVVNRFDCAPTIPVIHSQPYLRLRIGMSTNEWKRACSTSCVVSKISHLKPLYSAFKIVFLWYFPTCQDEFRSTEITFLLLDDAKFNPTMFRSSVLLGKTVRTLCCSGDNDEKCVHLLIFHYAKFHNHGWPEQSWAFYVSAQVLNKTK